jgi:hypothetical protein
MAKRIARRIKLPAEARTWNSSLESEAYLKIARGRMVKPLSRPVGLKVTKERAPRRRRGADSPIARETARIVPVAVPGTADGITNLLTACQ